MQRNFLVDQLKNLESYQKLLENVYEGTGPVSLYGLTEESLSHICYALKYHTGKQMLILTYDELRAKRIFENIQTFEKKDVFLFPSREAVFYNIDAYSNEVSHTRLKVLNQLVKKNNCIITSSIQSVLNKNMAYKIFKKNMQILKYGETVDLNNLIEVFIKQGYERVSMVEGKGQFSIRGGIIDFFPITCDNPFRIELFDNEIDSIRSFDIKTQRSIKNIDSVEIFPAKEILINHESRIKIVENIKQDLDDTLKRIDKNMEKEKIEALEEKFRHCIDRIENGLNVKNMDLIIPYMLSENLESIVSYLNNDSLIILDEPHRIEEAVGANKNEFINRYMDLFERGEVLSKHQDLYFKYEDIIKDVKNHFCITSTGIMKKISQFKSKNILDFTTKDVQSFYNKLDLLVDDLKHYKYRGYKIIILSGSVDRGIRLGENLRENNVECRYTDNLNEEIKSGQVFITPMSGTKGFEYPKLKFVIISDKEIYGIHKKKRTSKQRKDSRKISSFTDLNVGDYVVHETHGIGKYMGIEQLDVQGVKKDYLSIKYQGQDKLYVPVDQMNLIQKYIGADSVKPKVNKLGSSDWAKTKAKVKRAIEDMAKDLLELYAKRESTKGFAFSKDQPWQRQFEDLFPYEETEDQLRCIEEIKRDMEKDRPMDRLLCGDVGYGKTEVALRAAFKAVMDGKQVAFLVPTTILAQQHYNTLIDRFSQFPVKIEMLSRFRTPAQQKNIINSLKRGSIDIIVGTHRLLSKDIKFYDLGLLIVDEEQRFGVKHKETLKKLKETVDVLTLTATPIPRTLHMSLVGIRDMSIIEEPPEERYPIETYVLEYNEQLVRDAIIRELNRNGQVYFVYNRVQGIQKIASRLKELVPEARIAIGHGQMSERQLEKVMIDFLNKKYDVLVCTTIIETGLDISNVNTIVVYDADKMGLSQLYQLRGRVGRSNRLAYSYFTYQRDKVLSEVAEKRLKAIKEFTEFGSGFKIAMRDLEIRGAGNLLGAEQHGHMEAIGYDLYVKFLEDAIKKLKGDKISEQIETTIDLNVDGYISEKYINDEEQKIEIYKKISSIQSKDDYSDVLEEIMDRYGEVPYQVINLMKISLIKHLANKAKIYSITQKGKEITIEFFDKDIMKPEFINKLVMEYGRKITFDLSKKPIIRFMLPNEKQDDVLDRVQKIVEKISSLNN